MTAGRRFMDGTISGVEHRTLREHDDQRGWLCELFRRDELPAGCGTTYPQMGYASLTQPGVLRGPHEHEQQTDVFVFQGVFEVYLWDAREHSLTHLVRQKIRTSPDRLSRVIVPPGVIHGYRNTSDRPQISFNFPDRLYKGWNRSEPVDEIRHEDADGLPYEPW